MSKNGLPWLLKIYIINLTFCVICVLVIFHLSLQICSQLLSVMPMCLVSHDVLPMFFVSAFYLDLVKRKCWQATREPKEHLDAHVCCFVLLGCSFGSRYLLRLPRLLFLWYSSSTSLTDLGDNGFPLSLSLVPSPFLNPSVQL